MFWKKPKGGGRCRETRSRPSVRLTVRATIAAVAAGATLGACTTQLDDAAARSLQIRQSRDARERSLQQSWIGRTRADLVQVFGRPAMVMGVPGARLPESIILVFRGADPAGNCIDAFVVLRDEAETIWNYFCR